MDKVNIKTLGEIDVDVTKQFDQLAYQPQSGSVDYVDKATLNVDAKQEQEILSKDISHFNIGSLSLWNQISNPHPF